MGYLRKQTVNEKGVYPLGVDLNKLEQGLCPCKNPTGRFLSFGKSLTMHIMKFFPLQIPNNAYHKVSIQMSTFLYFVYKITLGKKIQLTK
jgi:hypothetical protein